VRKEEAQNAVFRINRFGPKEDLPPDSFLDQLNNKSLKLTRYVPLGYRTILLLENSDIALMNPFKMERAVQYWKEHTPTIVPDEIWYADTSIVEQTEFYPINNHTSMDLAH
jgi:hypothetical protein